jgi:hypothetical protein
MSAFVGLNCNNIIVLHAAQNGKLVDAQRAKQDARICWFDLQ